MAMLAILAACHKYFACGNKVLFCGSWPLAVYCFYVCSGSVLLGDLLGVSRYMERDLLSVLSIYPRDFLACIHCV